MSGFGFGIFILIWLIVMFGSLALSIAMYVCGCLGTYTIAKRRGINRPWLSWIPVANAWTLGCISDQYQQVVCGKTTGRRKILLTLNILSAVLCAVIFAVYFSILVEAIAFIVQNVEVTDAELDFFVENQLLPEMISMLVVAGIVALALMIIGVVATVFSYIALYDLYRSANPDNAVLFLVLGIVFNFTQPFFVFACRNKDLGMPPRSNTYFPPQNPPTF